jgi:hypothetical protein
MLGTQKKGAAKNHSASFLSLGLEARKSRAPRVEL